MTPLHDAGTERTLIGAAILDPLSVASMEPLDPRAFYVPEHAAIWTGILALAGKPWTVGSLRASMGAAATPAVRGALSNAEANVYSSGGLDELAQRLRELRTRRQVAALGDRLKALSQDADVDSAAMLAEVDAGVMALSEARGRSSVVGMDTAVMEAVQALQDAQKGNRKPGVPFGVSSLDSWTRGGMRAGEIWILGARPGIGKSALAAQSLVAAAKAGIRSLLVTLEMTRAEVATRAICTEAQVDQRKASKPRGCADYEMDRIARAAADLMRLPIHMEDGFAAGIADIRAVARRIAAQHPDLGFIVVDYLQLMGGAAKAQQNRQEEISGISRGLKMLAKEMGLPILALAQLSRDVEKGKRRPQLSDLRESGSLEQDASGVIFLHRDPDAKPSGDLEAFETSAMVSKQRNGSIGIVELSFEAKITRFRAKDYE